MTSLASVLDMEVPIVQAPMAGAQDSELAASVSNAGGLGSLACAMLTVEGMRRELTQLSARTTKPYNVNFFCHAQPVPDAAREAAWRVTLSPYYREFGLETPAESGASRRPFNADAVGVIEEFKPAVVSFHFGLPATELLARVKRTRAKIFATATTVDEARWLQAHGADVIIAQGLEAGGHRGHFLSSDLTLQMGTLALVSRVVKAVSIPVIAAGGIANASGVKAALALGAAAAQVGTAYLLTPEAATSAVHRAAVASEAARNTEVTNLFSGRPARGIVNRLMRDLGPMRPDVPQFPLASIALAPLRATAEAQGRGDFSPLWAGQNVSGCRSVGAAQLTRELASP